MAEVPALNTIYYRPTIVPPSPSYGAIITFIGTSSTGPYMQPTYVRNPMEAVQGFGSGELVEACEEAYDVGARHIHLCRINQDGEDPWEIDRYARLEIALNLLLTYPTHIVVPLGMFFDDEENYVSLLVQYCDRCEEHGGSIAVISTKPIDLGGESVPELVTRLFTYDRARSNLGNAAKCISVVAAEAGMYSGMDKYRMKPGAAIYGALLTTILPGHSPINKPFGIVDSLKYGLSLNSEMTITIDPTLGTVILPRHPLNDVVVSSGGMVYNPNSDYLMNYETSEISLPSGSRILGPVDVTFKYNDYDTLASCGYVTFMEFARTGIAPASAVTMAKGSPQWYVNTTRVLQDIAWHIRNSQLVPIGTLQARTLHIQQDIESYLSYLANTMQIHDDYSVSLEYGDTDLSIVIAVRDIDSLTSVDMHITLDAR